MARRLPLHLWLAFRLLLLAAVASAQPAVAVEAGAAARIAARVEAVGMTVANMDRSIGFYSTVLGFEKVSDVEVAGSDYERLLGVFGARVRVVRMRLGDEILELTEFLTPSGRPVPADFRGNDRWFQHVAIVVSDMGRAYRRLRDHRVAHVSTGPQRLPDWNRNAAGIEAFYFADPDGHRLELLAFPPDKGDPKWHRPADRLFLGIDHTAIVVGDTEASLRFYRDLLGFEVAGESENYGAEQEHLNSVFGARLRITTLRAAGGPGIELLEYLAPRDGRPAPADLRANDLVAWRTTVLTGDATAAAARLRAGRAAFVSPGAIGVADRALGFGVGLLVNDPDGHTLQMIER